VSSRTRAVAMNFASLVVVPLNSNVGFFTAARRAQTMGRMLIEHDR
jgi:hypothetical protein